MTARKVAGAALMLLPVIGVGVLLYDRGSGLVHFTALCSVVLFFLLFYAGAYLLLTRGK